MGCSYQHETWHAMRRFDLALFLELNDAYRAKPLVAAPRSLEPAAIALRGATRARKLAKEFELEGKSVLEIGCGRGEVAHALAADHGCRVVAIDIKRRAEWAEANGVEFLVADLADGAPSKLDAFDFVFSSAVWEHVRHPYTMLKEAKKLLAPDGVFRLSANLYRGPQASHRYHEVFFPCHTCCSRTMYSRTGTPSLGQSSDRRRIPTLLRSARVLRSKIVVLDHAPRPGVLPEVRGSVVALSDLRLERDFIHVVLLHRHGGGHTRGTMRAGGLASFPLMRRLWRTFRRRQRELSSGS
jgi:SAM-dependent methyltransferase